MSSPVRVIAQVLVEERPELADVVTDARRSSSEHGAHGGDQGSADGADHEPLLRAHATPGGISWSPDPSPSFGVRGTA